jgi:GTP cyclohydrolase I
MNDRLAVQALQGLSAVEPAMPDVQGRVDQRQVAISRVGVKRLRYPVRLAEAGQEQHSVAQWTLDVALPADQKGAHMSRLVAWLDDLHASQAPLSAAVLPALLDQLLDRMETQAGGFEASFPFFVRKTAPVSGVQSLLEAQGAWRARRGATGATQVSLQVDAPVKSLCPCSKEVSDYGAHNQRSIVSMQVALQPGVAMGLGELLRVAEQAASSEIWPLLKRGDEKWVTERAYDNPKFVEDLIRDVATALRADPRIATFAVEVENFESIHAHSAWARVEHSG